MARRRYLIAYDIREQHRLRRVATTLEDFGLRTQYSVFLCDLSPADLADLTCRLRQIIDSTEDSVLIVDIGNPDHKQVVTFLGPARPQPASRPQVI